MIVPMWFSRSTELERVAMIKLPGPNKNARFTMFDLIAIANPAKPCIPYSLKVTNFRPYSFSSS